MNDKMVLHEAQDTVFGPGEQLVEKWGKYMDVIQEVAKDEGRHVDDITLMTTAICLENLEQHLGRLDEATLSTAVGSFIHHGFDLIAAVMPSLIANQIVSIQPQTRKIGEIFYMEFLYGKAKGNINKGDTMFGYQTAGNSEIWYTSDNVPDEIVGTGTGSEDGFSGNLGSFPMVGGSLSVTDGVEVFADNGKGVLTGDKGGTGIINYTNGAYDVTFKTAPLVDVNVLATYRIDFEANPDLIPEVNLSIQSMPTIARPRKLRARYTLDASFDVSSAFGRSVGTELDVALASEIRQEIDGELMQAMMAQYGSGLTEWSRKPGDGISYAEHKWTFIDSIIAASNAIFTATRRAVANFIVAGIGVCNVIESLAPRFKPAGKVQPGPHFIGTLDNLKVYKNPYYSTYDAIAGYKGDLFMEAGLVYAPYMPLFTTQPIMLDDFITRKGLATSYSKKMVQPKFYQKLTVTNT